MLSKLLSKFPPGKNMRNVFGRQSKKGAEEGKFSPSERRNAPGRRGAEGIFCERISIAKNLFLSVYREKKVSCLGCRQSCDS